MDAIFPNTLDDGRSGLAVVVTRAALDRHFRRDLLADPHRAVRESFGMELPPGLRLKFIEKDSDVDLLVVLPDLVEGGEPLDPDQLDVVLGGAAQPFHAAAGAAAR
jgi:hypothetical protein